MKIPQNSCKAFKPGLRIGILCFMSNAMFDKLNLNLIKRLTPL